MLAVAIPFYIFVGYKLFKDMLAQDFLYQGAVARVVYRLVKIGGQGIDTFGKAFFRSPCKIWKNKGTAHAVTHVPLDFKCHPELLFHFKDIPVAPYGMPGSDEIIENARPYLLHRNLVLMANHGVLSIASNLALACQRVVAAEKFARVMCIARQIGEPVDIPETEIYRLLGRELEL